MKIKTNMFFVFLLMGIACGGGKNLVQQDSQNNNVQNCTNLLIDNHFANNPIGQMVFEKSHLIDNLFKDIYRSECVEGIGDEQDKYFINFYRGKNRYAFIREYKKETYRFHGATINEENTHVKLVKRDKKFGVNYTKSFIAEVFDAKGGNICDSLAIYDEEHNSGHTFYFKNDLLSKIKLFSTKVD